MAAQPVCRVGDIGYGYCPAHDKGGVSYTTTIITGEDSMPVDGKPVAVVGSLGSCTCGHQTVQQTGSPKLFAGGKAVARVGDKGANFGEYTMATGSPTFSSE